MEEIHQHRDRKTHQNIRHQQRKLRDKSRRASRCIKCAERLFVGFANSAQSCYRKYERGNEGRKAELIAAVFHKIGQHAGAIGAAGIRHCGDRDRKHRRCHTDHRSGYDREHIRCPLWACRLDPFDAIEPVGPANTVKIDGRERQQEGGHRKHCRVEPVTGIYTLPAGDEESDHAWPLAVLCLKSFTANPNVSASIPAEVHFSQVAHTDSPARHVKHPV